MVILQWLASANVSGHGTDLTNAFGQARKTCVRAKLAESQYDCGSVGLGLCQEPLRQVLVFTLFSNEDTSEGQVLIDVDDFTGGHTARP